VKGSPHRENAIAAREEWGFRKHGKGSRRVGLKGLSSSQTCQIGKKAFAPDQVKTGGDECGVQGLAGKNVPGAVRGEDYRDRPSAEEEKKSDTEEVSWCLAKKTSIWKSHPGRGRRMSEPKKETD